jgi:hypothetical protein
VRNLDQILLVVNKNKTQMTDEQRLELINQAGDQLDNNFSDLKRFNFQNTALSLLRAKESGDINTTRSLYGIN